MPIRRSTKYADYEPDVGVFDDLANDVPVDTLSVQRVDDGSLVITKGDSVIRLSRNETVFLRSLLSPERGLYENRIYAGIYAA